MQKNGKMEGLYKRGKVGFRLGNSREGTEGVWRGMWCCNDCRETWMLKRLCVLRCVCRKKERPATVSAAGRSHIFVIDRRVGITSRRVRGACIAKPTQSAWCRR
jgi:hypothetical protein